MPISSVVGARKRHGCKAHLTLLMFAAIAAGCATSVSVQDEVPQPAAAPPPPVVGTAVPAATAPSPAATQAVEARTPGDLGVQVTALRLSAGGFMVDLRYRVVDPERAKGLLDRRVAAYLVDEASGAKFGVPNSAKLGKLRQAARGTIQTDREYMMLFGNPGRYLKPGAKVTLVAGDAQLAALTIQ